jgi:hypothetical protein
MLVSGGQLVVWRVRLPRERVLDPLALATKELCGSILVH